jgi:hypothetical protein
MRSFVCCFTGFFLLSLCLFSTMCSAVELAKDYLAAVESIILFVVRESQASAKVGQHKRLINYDRSPKSK